MKLRKILQEIEDNTNDKLIYNLLSDWIISSLDETAKRQEIGKSLSELNIPNKYKTVPTSTLYRIGSTKSKFISYAYDYRGTKKMAQWYKKIFKKDIDDSDIIERNVSDVNVLICIPTFLKLTKFSSGRRFDALWKSEYEVICINDNNINS